jgi:hypothetical protein
MIPWLSWARPFYTLLSFLLSICFSLGGDYPTLKISGVVLVYFDYFGSKRAIMRELISSLLVL